MTSKGNAQPAFADSELTNNWDQAADYSLLKQISDPRFGEGSVLKNAKTAQCVFAKRRTTTNRNDAYNMIRDLRTRKGLNSPYLQHFLGFSSAIAKDLCSTNYVVESFYEFPPQDALQRAEGFKKDKQPAPVQEVRDLVANVGAALQHVQNGAGAYGDLRLDLVMLAPPDVSPANSLRPRFKLMDRIQDPSPFDKVQVNNSVAKKPLYLSPENWRALQGRDKTLKTSAVDNDYYALGLLALAFAGDSYQDAYQPAGEFNQARLDARVTAFANRYRSQDPLLVSAVQLLLAANPVDRAKGRQQVAGLQPNVGGNNFSAPMSMVPNMQSVYGQPSITRTYVQAEPVTYTYTQPTVTYVQGAPLSYVPSPVTTTYVQSDPMAYSYTNPTTITTINADGSKVERKSYTRSYVPPVTTVTTVGSDGKVERKSYTRTYAAPLTTVTTLNAAPMTTVTTINADGSKVERKSYTYSYAAPVTTVTYVQPATTYTTNSSQSEVKNEFQAGDVGRESNAQSQTLSKKKYIIEGDKVIEVDADQQGN